MAQLSVSQRVDLTVEAVKLAYYTLDAAAKGVDTRRDCIAPVNRYLRYYGLRNIRAMSKNDAAELVLALQ